MSWSTFLYWRSQKNPKVRHDFRDPWEKALKVAEIDDFRWHDLRHSCASYLAMSGVPMRSITEILGKDLKNQTT